MKKDWIIPKLKRIGTGYYEMKFKKWIFYIILTDDGEKDGNRALDVFEKDNNGLSNRKYSLYHPTKKECVIQLEMMLNNEFLID